MRPMKKVLLDLYATHNGTIKRLLTSVIAGALTAIVSKAGMQLSDETVITLTGLVVAAVQGFIGELVLKDQRAAVQEMQAILQPLAPEVQTDKHLGPVTLAAARKVADVAAAAPAATLEAANLSPQPHSP